MAKEATWAGLRAIAPMLATLGRLPSDAQDSRFGYEVKWDGVRAIGYLGRDRFQLVSRNDRDITAAYPELTPRSAELARLAGRRGLVVDGEIVAFDAAGRPSFGALQQRMHVRDAARIARLSERTPVAYIVFDVLRRDGRSLLDEPYRERRSILAALDLAAVSSWQTPDYQAGDGAGLYAATREEGLEGVIAKRLESTYQPGRRSPDWIKIKHVRTQEVVVGGWTPGEGRRRGAIGSLLLGIPVASAGTGSGTGTSGSRTGRRGGSANDTAPDALEFVGLVGTGFTEQSLADLGKRLDALATERSPFGGRVPPAIEREARWVQPKLVGEVVYAERTRDGMLRTPSWRGLRPDKTPHDVHVE
ncbi:DNA ligase [Actinocrinis sp.]|uniref:ATP-dependent DNA ligase n=1 Tax=Actinocrinis sp. TaxID=1920516 RepID=UPI002D48C0AE|nr:DNA ligase [Actinocrinis sp.]HZP52064.1 DNA ligase [Actinocrinis sp.]